MKNSNYASKLLFGILIVFTCLYTAPLKAQCDFSNFDTLQIFSGTTAVFEVEDVINYQPTFSWDFSAASSNIVFSNPTSESIQIAVADFVQSEQFWLKFNYTDLNCSINDSIYVDVIGFDQFDLLNSNSVLCSSDQGALINVNTDLILNGISYNVLDNNGVQVQQNITNWPSNLASGDYSLEVNWQGYTSSCSVCQIFPTNQILLPFHVKGDFANNLSCNDGLEVAIGESCVLEPTLDIFLENSFNLSPNAFSFSFYDGIDLVDQLDSDYIGVSIDFKVEEACSGNTCWGSLTIVDYLAPVFDTQNIDVNTLCGLDSPIPTPTVIDNCDQSVSVLLTSSLIENYDCDSQNGLIKMETRTYYAVDEYGNASEDFEQKIYTRIPTIAEIEYPSHLDDNQSSSLRCSEAEYTEPLYTGYPSAFGVNFIPGTDYCGISTSYSDQVFDGCGDGFTILRTWLILRNCGQDSEVAEYDQFIYVKDELSPFIQCPQVLDVEVSNQDCVLENWLLELLVVDDCSELSWTATGDNWIIQEGEVLPNLALGTHSVNINAIDDCGNQSNCSTSIEIVDAMAPTAVCIEVIDVSLNSEGVAVVQAESIDNGSYDNCSQVNEFQVRMMGASFGDSVLITCDIFDPNAPNFMLEMQIRDEQGNSNSCMVMLEVSDKISPSVTCPTAGGFDCTDLVDIDDLWPEIVYSDNCNSSVSFGDVNDADLDYNCYIGSVERVVTVVDDSGNSSSCVQQISFDGIEPLGNNDIEWPEDLFFESCEGVSYNPDSIGLDVGLPLVTGPFCSISGVNYTDQIFYTGGTECFKVIRSWIVIDWCHYDANAGIGFFDHVQEIRVQDNQAPVVDCNITPFVKLDTPDCFGEITFELPYIIEECSNDVTIDVSSILGGGVGPFQDVGLGDYMVTYTISDPCGNVTTCLVNYNVSDAKEPVAYCVDQLIIEIPAEQEIEIVASDFDFASYDNCTQEELLVFAFSALPFDSIRTFDCNDIGINELDMYVFDAEGNFDRCTVSLEVQDNNQNCDTGQLSLSGTISDIDYQALEDVEVFSNGLLDYSTFTSETGAYNLDDLTLGSDYSISADYDDISPIGESVTTFDMVLITMHILGIELLDSPYHWIAADVNDSGTITTLDIVAIRKVILQIEDEFPNGKRWKFVDRSYEFTSSINPLLDGYPELININNLEIDIIDLDFVAIRMGDVN
jgi:hypothetical protein